MPPGDRRAPAATSAEAGPQAARSAPRPALLRRTAGLVAFALYGSLLLFALTLHGVALFGFRDAAKRALPERAPLVVVLGAGMAADGTLGIHTVTRFEAALRLIEAGLANRIHFAGGDTHRGITEGELMARLARERFPDLHITHEDRSRSTLQNAWFTVDAIGRLPAATILVTDASHLFRAWAAFTWAGSPALVPYPAKPFTEPFGPALLDRLLREAAGTWLNALRGLRYGAALLTGTAPAEAEALLAEGPW
jgi:uncharacterized SAM-binding protein YcdF (DUF218 family)